MGAPVRSKKMAVSSLLDVAAATGLLKAKMVRIGTMADRILRLDRRELLTGLGATAAAPVLPLDRGRPGAVAAGPASQSRHRSPCGRERPDTPIWSLGLRPGPRSVQARRDARGHDSKTDCRCPRLQAGAGSMASRPPNRWPRGRRCHPGGAGNPSDSLASRRHLPVRLPPARRWSGAPVAGAGADRRRRASRSPSTATRCS